MKRLPCMLLALLLLTSCIPAVAEEDAPVQEVVTDTALDADEIRMLQVDLIAQGYLEGEADGIMGSGTQTAIRAAQEALGLEANGLMTAELREALQKDAFPLEIENRSSTVYELQESLCQWGFLETEPTGYFGESTKDAVAFFQRYAIDGYAARKQREADAEYDAMEVPEDVVVDRVRYSEDNIPCDGVMTQDWYDFMRGEFELPNVAIGLDDRGDDVQRAQNRLHSLGYLYRGMDGVFGDATVLALKYFQRRNKLPETGICDGGTCDALFSADAVKSDQYVMTYMAYVERSKSRVHILGWDGSGYNVEAKTFKCSCGAKKTPTIEGTYYAEGPIEEWYYMASSNVWVRYAFKIVGNYFFHSVLYHSKGGKNPTSTSVNNLGRNVSHGCIRLAVEDVKWIYENCPKGMKVVIV